jgi:anti-anti-sigma factor
MEIGEEVQDQALIMIPRGRLDSRTAPMLQEQLMQRIESAPSLLIDCAHLDYVSSAGLRVLLMGGKQSKQAGRGFALCSLQDSVREVFEISGFLSVLSCYGDRSQALSALAG